LAVSVIRLANNSTMARRMNTPGRSRLRPIAAASV
jgi:hypothetical protein